LSEAWNARGRSGFGCFRACAFGVGAESFHALPVAVEGALAIACESRGGERPVAMDGLLDLDEAGFFEPGELDGKIAASESGGAREKEEVCTLAGGEHGEDGEACGLVNEAVYVRDDVAGCDMQRLSHGRSLARRDEGNDEGASGRRG
jgi:hypothetical protein